MKNLIRCILFILFFIGDLLDGTGQGIEFTLDQFKSGSTQSEISLFNEETPIEITLSTDLKTLIFDVGDDRESHPATLTYLESTDTLSINVMLMTRGNFRRDRLTCDFPPLHVDFENDTLTGSPFLGMKDAKLVTHCRDRKINEQYVLEEYLIYKIYNLFTDLSFKVRLAQITYTDTKGKIKPVRHFAFFIEPTAEMAERNGGRELELEGLALNYVNHPFTNMFTVFQYFIANTDWSIRVLHNVKLVSITSEPMALPVPYDFDFSGVIYTYYSAPDPLLGIASVRDRLFRSNCRKLEELEPTFELFRERKQQIYDMYLNFPYLEEKRVKKILQYYDEFYETINDERSARKAFERCTSN